MERHIKFRGKRADNGEWVQGYFVEDGFYCIWSHNEDDFLTQHLIDPDTLGQFTGLTDCNGKEIYEGDILETIYKYEDVSGGAVIPDCDCICKGVVEWNGEVAGWVLKAQTAEYPMKEMLKEHETDLIPINVFYCDYMGVDYPNECIEVIGTIHDNPELINQPTEV